MKKWKAVTVLILLFAFSVFADKWEIPSPDKQVQIRVENSPQLIYSVRYGNREILKNSAITLLMNDGSAVGVNLSLVKIETASDDEVWTPVVGRHKQIRDRYNELTVYLKEAANPGWEI